MTSTTDSGGRTGPRRVREAAGDRRRPRSPQFEEPSADRRSSGCSTSCTPTRRPSPSSCCCSASLAFSVDRRRALLCAVQPVAHPAAGDDHRHPRHRPDAGHPDRRHRPFGRRHHGPVASVVMGQLAVDAGAAGRRSPSRSGLLVRPGLRPHQRRAGHLSEAAALHRHARHLEHLRRAEPLVFAEPDDPAAATSRRRRRSCSSWASPIQFGGAQSHLRLDPDAPARGHRLVHAQPDRLRPPHPCDRRRRGSGAPRRHPHRPHADRRLHHRRPDLRDRRLGADRAHRRGQPAIPARPPTSIRSPPW